MADPKCDAKSKTQFVDVEAEKDFLAAIVQQQSIIDEYDGIIETGDFTDPVARHAYRIFVNLHQAGIYLQDFNVVLRELKSSSKIARGDAEGLIGRCASGVPGHAPFHAKLILDASKKRRLSAALEEASLEILEKDADVSAISQRLEAELGMISSSRSVERARPIEDFAKLAMEDIRASVSEKRILGIPTGLFDLDGVFGGWHKSELTIVAGQPGGGKTALALQTGKFAAQRGHSVLIASLEMSAKELSQRYLCSDARVNSRSLRTGKLTAAELARLEESLAKLKGLPLHIWDPPMATMTQVHAEARRMQATRGCDLVVVDYLLLIAPGPDTRKLDKHHQIGDSVRRLKHLARDVSVPVMCVSQVNRDGAKSGRLRKHHLAESADTERNADNIIFLNDGDRPGEVIVGIEKQRNGPIGEVTLSFDAERTIFIDSLGAIL